MLMQFDSFLFPYNPRKIELIKKKNAVSYLTLDGKISSKNYGDEPMVVKCQGELYGEKGRKIFDGLGKLFEEGKSAPLSIPFESPFYARLKKLSLLGEGAGDIINFYAEFEQSN